MSSKRYVELDALRGIAAVIVVFGHYASAYSLKPNVRYHPLFAGRESVMLFFVLSGFVLSLPFWNKGGNGPYVRYLVRRFCRIYLPFAGALILAAIGAHFFLFSTLNLNAWFNGTWQTPLTPGLFISQFLMEPTPKLNTAFWSLRYEMQMSIALPFVLLLMRRIGLAASLGIAAIIYFLAVGHGNGFHYAFQTLQYAVMFVLGALLAKERDAIREVWEATPRSAKILFPLASAVVYFFASIAAYRYNWGFSDLLVALGACGVIISAMQMPAFGRVLRLPAPQYFGRISYSLYLVHATVLFALLNLLYRRLSPVVFLAVFLASSLLASHVFCVLVEEPAMRLGKRLANFTFPEVARYTRLCSSCLCELGTSATCERCLDHFAERNWQ